MVAYFQVVKSGWRHLGDEVRDGWVWGLSAVERSAAYVTGGCLVRKTVSKQPTIVPYGPSISLFFPSDSFKRTAASAIEFN
jgi:hypothetical protein